MERRTFLARLMLGTAALALDPTDILTLTPAPGLPSAAPLTLIEWAKRLDPDGRVASIIELLSQTNDILDDVRWLDYHAGEQ